MATVWIIQVFRGDEHRSDLLLWNTKEAAEEEAARLRAEHPELRYEVVAEEE